MRTPEADLKDKVKKMLSLLAPQMWFWMPVPMGFGIKGIPDFVGCWKGHFFSIETKAPRGKATKWQERIHQLILVAGGSVCVAYSTEDVSAFLRKIQGMRVRNEDTGTYYSGDTHGADT
jgi:hypothetical protein